MKRMEGWGRKILGRLLRPSWGVVLRLTLGRRECNGGNIGRAYWRLGFLTPGGSVPLARQKGPRPRQRPSKQERMRYWEWA